MEQLKWNSDGYYVMRKSGLQAPGFGLQVGAHIVGVVHPLFTIAPAHKQVPLRLRRFGMTSRNLRNATEECWA
jgi:hypothetical protein